MKVLITYFSQTGNTEMVARSIYDEIIEQGHVCHLESLKAVNARDLGEFDLVFLGAACHDSDLAKPALRFLDEIEPSASFKMAGFATHSTNLPVGSERNKELYKQWAWKIVESFKKAGQNKGIEMLGYFGCMGKPSQPIEVFIRNNIITEEKEWEDYIKEARQHPDETDLSNARIFAREIAVKAA